MQSDDYILAKRHKGKSITQQAIDYKLKQTFKIVFNDITKAHCHVFRHTRAIHILDSGEDIMKVKTILGHSNIVNTLIYLKYSNKAIFDSLNRVNDSVYRF